MDYQIFQPIQLDNKHITSLTRRGSYKDAENIFLRV